MAGGSPTALIPLHQQRSPCCFRLHFLGRQVRKPSVLRVDDERGAGWCPPCARTRTRCRNRCSPPVGPAGSRTVVRDVPPPPPRRVSRDLPTRSAAAAAPMCYCSRCPGGRDRPTRFVERKRARRPAEATACAGATSAITRAMAMLVIPLLLPRPGEDVVQTVVALVARVLVDRLGVLLHRHRVRPGAGPHRRSRQP